MISPNAQRLRIGLLISLLILTPCGFYTKFYSGPYQSWVADSLSGVLYVIFWCLVLKLSRQQCNDFKIASLVLLLTIGLEFLQLWHPPVLEALRRNFIGRTILGNSFSWFDLPYYVLGSGIGYGWLKLLGRWAIPARTNSSLKYSAK